MRDLNRHGDLSVSTSAYGSLAKQMAKIGESEGLRKDSATWGDIAVRNANEGRKPRRDNREQATKPERPLSLLQPVSITVHGSQGYAERHF